MLRRMAERKSTNCLGTTNEKKDSLVIASDTTVVLNQEIMGKPADEWLRLKYA